MNPKHLHILQHSLGCDKHGQGTQYRNYFCTGPGTTDWPLCQELVILKLMEDSGKQPMLDDMHYFRVTEEGKRQMKLNSPARPKLSAGKRRYQDFLHADCGMTFIEWLRATAKFNREGSAFK